METPVAELTLTDGRRGPASRIRNAVSPQVCQPAAPSVGAVTTLSVPPVSLGRPGRPRRSRSAEQNVSVSGSAGFLPPSFSVV